MLTRTSMTPGLSISQYRVVNIPIKCRIGLFLGAGASYEGGMPLVWELTAEIKNWLTPTKMRELNAGWRRLSVGYSDEVIEDLISILARKDVHYEAALGYLEVQFRRQS